MVVCRIIYGMITGPYPSISPDNPRAAAATTKQQRQQVAAAQHIVLLMTADMEFSFSVRDKYKALFRKIQPFRFLFRSPAVTLSGPPDAPRSVLGANLRKKQMRRTPIQRGAPHRVRRADLLLDLFEIAFVDSADGACPVVGNLFERRSGGDASVGIADCGIVDPLADYTTILFHLLLFFIRVNDVPAN